VLVSKDTTEVVEKELLEYIQRYVPVRGEAHLAGNSVHFDKAFMKIEFPSVIDWLHYRIIGTPSPHLLCSVVGERRRVDCRCVDGEDVE